MVLGLWLGTAGWSDWDWVVKPAHMSWWCWHGIGSMTGIRVGKGVMVQVWKKGWRWWEGDGGRGEGRGSTRHTILERKLIVPKKFLTNFFFCYIKFLCVPFFEIHLIPLAL